ncbi:MAG: NFACT RNA binding domain-containing protein [Candidatus Aenigmarchaeota archaeon]|nr:NFACT RNA binding domain-containing protein [Candidatus Aenigmarchaeota archaeon]
MTDVEIDFRKNAQVNANEYFKKAKSSKKKLESAKFQLEKTLDKMKAPPAPVEREYSIVKKREKQWYEKFRWEITSDGFLVIGGKDADQNEMIFSKYIEKNDIVLHADIVGAPLVVIKSEGKEITDLAKREAAELAAAYSSAWKKGLGAVDVYWITPEQVSKTPESGEYLSKGGFVIRGTKNYSKKVELKLSIGVKIEDGISLIAGSIMAVRKHSKYFVTIVPGDINHMKLATDVRHKLIEKASAEDKEMIKKLDINEIQGLIPGGEGCIV